MEWTTDRDSLKVLDYHPEDELNPELYPTRVMIQVEGDFGSELVTLPVPELKEFSQQLVAVMTQIALDQAETSDELVDAAEFAEHVEQFEPDETTD
jgi:hypothetical protein